MMDGAVHTRQTGEAHGCSSLRDAVPRMPQTLPLGVVGCGDPNMMCPLCGCASHPLFLWTTPTRLWELPSRAASAALRGRRASHPIRRRFGVTMLAQTTDIEIDTNTSHFHRPRGSAVHSGGQRAAQPALTHRYSGRVVTGIPTGRRRTTSPPGRLRTAPRPAPHQAAGQVLDPSGPAGHPPATQPPCPAGHPASSPEPPTGDPVEPPTRPSSALSRRKPN